MTSLVTCDQLIASFTSSLGSASPSQIAALTAALTAAGVSGGASGTAGGALTGTYPNPGLNAASVAAALATSGVGTGAFVAQSVGTAMPNSTEVTLASWTAPRAGVIAATFGFSAITDSATTQILAVSKIFKGATQVAAAGSSLGDSQSEVRNAFSQTSNHYITVAAGDVITGKGFVGADPAVASTTNSVAGIGLSLHYIS